MTGDFSECSNMSNLALTNMEVSKNQINMGASHQPEIKNKFNSHSIFNCIAHAQDFNKESLPSPPSFPYDVSAA